MYYKNARIFAEDRQFHIGAFEVVDGCFGEVFPCDVPADAIDLGGATVIPGLIEIHAHGNSNVDFSDGDYEGLQKMAKYYAQNGITSFVATSVSVPYEQLNKAFMTARKLADTQPEGCSFLRGIHMEGPYFCFNKRGGMNPVHLKEPDFKGFLELFNACDGLIRIVDIAPELPGAYDFIRNASKLCKVSVAHTEATYEQTQKAFSAGASHITHVFNAMPGIHHRDPGVIPATVDNGNISVELIGDGLHVHPSIIRMAFKLFGPERIVLISDSLRCCGMPDRSKFSIGGQEATLIDGVARLSNGTIAGSSVNLYQCMVNLMQFGIPEEDAVLAATLNPARAIDAQTLVGSIAPGKNADFLICSADYKQKRVFLSGNELT